jgi:hypothetical protein
MIECTNPSVGDRFLQAGPKTFCWLQLRGVGRQCKDFDSGRKLHVCRLVKARLIPKQQDDFVFGRVLKGEGFESQFGELAAYRRKKKPMGFPSGRIHKSVDVDPLILNPVHRSWFRVYFAPLAADYRLQAEAGFIFGPDFDLLVGMLFAELFDPFLKFFLKASCSSGEADRSCRRRGTCNDQPSRVR